MRVWGGGVLHAYWRIRINSHFQGLHAAAGKRRRDSKKENRKIAICEFMQFVNCN